MTGQALALPESERNTTDWEKEHQMSDKTDSGQDDKSRFNSTITSEDVSELYLNLKENNITVWIDGGWCIDALLGRQTRLHQDLDIAVSRKDSTELRCLLENIGFSEEPRHDSSEFMYVMKNYAGKRIDVHVFEYDSGGRNIYGIAYPFGSLSGKGVIDGLEVNCIDPEWMFKFKTSYEPKEKDIHDVRALSKKFEIEMPERYKN